MGYASYLEDIVERALEHNPPRLPKRQAFAAASFLVVLSPRRRSISTPTTASTKIPPPDATLVARRTRDLRAIHILALSEMRPRYQTRSLHP
jgi:hypothetical protein